MESTTKPRLLRAMVVMRSELLRTARPLAFGAYEAEDLVHATYERALERAHTVRHDENLTAWLRRLLVNIAIDRLRRKHRLVPLDDLPVADTALPLPRWRLVDEGQVRRGLDHLPPELARTFALHFFDRLSHSEIARRLQIPRTTVASRLHRARGRLRESLVPT